MLVYFTAQQHHLETRREMTPVLIDTVSEKVPTHRGAGGSFLLLLDTIISLHSVFGCHLSRQTHRFVQTPKRHLRTSGCLQCAAHIHEKQSHTSVRMVPVENCADGTCSPPAPEVSQDTVPVSQQSAFHRHPAHTANHQSR